LKNVLYYHIYLTDDYASWAYMFMEQFKKMEDHHLLKDFDEINIVCVSQQDKRVGIFADLCSTFREMNVFIVPNTHNDDNSMLQGINTDKTVTENVTMRKIWNDSKIKDMNVLYLHAKGITSVDNHLKNGNVNTFKNYYYWREFLHWGVIERWRECVWLLNRYDSVGVNFFNEPSPHYSGNFWWSKSSYIKTLPNPATLEWWKKLQSETPDAWLRTAPDRFRDEMWLCSQEGNHLSLKSLDKVTNLSAELIKRTDYEPYN
jgi:hypothetical protein